MATEAHFNTLSKTLSEQVKEAIRMREDRLDRVFRKNLMAGFAAASNLFTSADPIGDFDALTQAGYSLDLLTGSYAPKRRKEAR